MPKASKSKKIPFVHLHNHFESSLNDSLLRVEAGAARAAELGMTAFAMTDHDCLYSLPAYLEACRRHGLKPIVGIEFYFVDKTEEYDPFSAEAPRGHLLLLAKNTTGLCSLIRLQNSGWRDRCHQGRLSLLDWNSLDANKEGLVCLTACLCGPLSTALAADDEALARERLGRLKDLFGADLAVELMDHGIESESRNTPRLTTLAKKEGVKTVATNDCHYVNQEEGVYHRLYYRLCRGRNVPDENKTDDFYIKSPEEMQETALPPDSLEQSAVIADQIEAYDLSRIFKNPSPPSSSKAVGLLRAERYSPAQALVRSARLMGVPLQLIQAVSGPEANAFSFEAVLDRSSAIKTAGERLPNLIPFARTLSGMIRCYEIDEERSISFAGEDSPFPLRRFGQVLLAQFDEEGCHRLKIETKPLDQTSPAGQAIMMEAEYRQGVQWYNRRRLDKAQKCFQSVLSRDGQHGDALYQMGLVYAIRNKHDRAITCFRKVLDLDPNFERLPFLQSWLGWSYYKNDQHKNALKSFEISVKLHSNLPGSLYGLGLLKFESGQRDEAEEILRRFIEISPPHPNVEEAQKMLSLLAVPQNTTF